MWNRPARASLGIGSSLLFAACTQLPAYQDDGGAGEVSRLAASVRIDEPGAGQVVVIINDNRGVSSHAGLFAGTELADPSGTYRGTRPLQDKTWRGPTLRDYLAYQLRDGPAIRSYRFTLSPSDFAAIQARVAQAGWTMPLFCAATVQDHLAGIGPFQRIESAWWTSLKALGIKLDQILRGHGSIGRCELPDAQPC